MDWRLHHRAETVSTNLDARAGRPGDVYTADFQTAGRGLLDHRWRSPPKANLLLSAVLPVDGLPPETVATLPLVVGFAVLQALRTRLSDLPCTLSLKWPNDILVDGRKIAGILCERTDAGVIAGIGVNVACQRFAPEVADRAVALGEAFVRAGRAVPTVEDVRADVLASLASCLTRFRSDGFAAFAAEIAAVDALRGRVLAVRQTDDDAEPVRGLCGGIQSDGSLLVGDAHIYAGEAHVL